MPKLIPISGRKMFIRKHQTGSHVRYFHPDGRKTVVPVHGNEELGKGLLNEILKQIKLSREDYEKLRRKV
jgi:predicted RNA binding protein YcfA (HicA-like mRNA interferase family)